MYYTNPLQSTVLLILIGEQSRLKSQTEAGSAIQVLAKKPFIQLPSDHLRELLCLVSPMISTAALLYIFEDNLLKLAGLNPL